MFEVVRIPSKVVTLRSAGRQARRAPFEVIRIPSKVETSCRRSELTAHHQVRGGKKPLEGCNRTAASSFIDNSSFEVVRNPLEGCNKNLTHAARQRVPWFEGERNPSKVVTRP